MISTDFNPEILLRLNRVTHFFDQRLVFKKVDLVVESGTITLIAGPNGAGKTTLMNVISGLISPSSGTVEHNVSRERMAYLGHNTFIYSGLSALDNLRFWAGIYGLDMDSDNYMELLRVVGLKPFAYEKAGNFSRGMAQRLSLARVLMLRPGLMLLDEPGTGLDTDSRELLREKIVSSAQDGAAVVWVSHSLDEDLEICHQVLFLDNKKSAFSGSASQYKHWIQEKGVEH